MMPLSDRRALAQRFASDHRRQLLADRAERALQSKRVAWWRDAADASDAISLMGGRPSTLRASYILAGKAAALARKAAHFARLVLEVEPVDEQYSKGHPCPECEVVRASRGSRVRINGVCRRCGTSDEALIGKRTRPWDSNQLFTC